METMLTPRTGATTVVQINTMTRDRRIRIALTRPDSTHTRKGYKRSTLGGYFRAVKLISMAGRGDQMHDPARPEPAARRVAGPRRA